VGEINVTSKEGEGTIFTVLLPVARDHIALSSEPHKTKSKIA
jgi:hypothetical protein